MNNRQAVITGGFGTLGLAVGRAFVQAGAKVALIDRAPVPQPLHSEFPSPHLLCGGVDLSQAAAAQQAMAAAATQLGGIDVLVNVAGGFRWETLLDGSLETWDFMYSLNLRTAVCACKAALPHMLARPSGRIINIGSGSAAAKAGAGLGAYAASKAGVAKLTEALAEELKDRSITVNAVLPSIIDTPVNRADMPDADFSRWVKPQAIADLIVYLASDAAAALTGASIPVQGRV